MKVIIGIGWQDMTGIDRLILNNHISHCIVNAVKEGDICAIDNLNEAIERFMR